MLRRKILIATGALALTVPTVAYADPADRFEDAPSSSRIGTTFKPASVDSDAKVTVMVEMTGDPVAVVEGQTGQRLSEARASKIRSGLKKSQDRVKSEIHSRGGKVFSQTQSAFNGMRASVPRKQLNAIAKLSGVKSVKAVPKHTIENATSVPFLGVPQVWQNTKYRGEGVKVAIIDTGIDYTHADFAGPGTVDAFNAAKASNTPDPAWFGPNAPRVKGGYDFVGDDYDASDPANSTPKPDANPLDCNGHGSHVAGTAGGGGVTADGAAYTGPYDASTPSKKWAVGPGVAPKVDLYALKVFGCEGSTDVVVEAIDWAVKNRMDVINMSLGSSFGTAQDADSIAAQNAQAAGVVVVASAGNSGPNPYLTGSPGVAKGVIGVAAVDSTPSFQAASMSFGGTTMAAINANGAELPSGSLTIVNLVDDPTTTNIDESLGCTPESFAYSGVTAGSDQIAVAVRGACARVRKAAAGQQAGAAAVSMVNNATSYPPVEGPITNVPADPDLDPPLPAEDYTVTVPFLGVRSSDGAALKAANGGALTLSAATMANPGFRAYATFSSGGPRSGDSGLSPSVSAPGVSIVSAGVGTGNRPATISGTSMASPHVAGVAALARQAHKGWTAGQVSAAIVTTADPAGVAGYRLTLGGGLVDTKQVVSTSIFAIGDRHSTRAGQVSEGTLSFGFHEPSSSYSGTKKLTLVNKGSKKVTFTLKNVKTTQSVSAKVRFSRTKVTVPARSSRTVSVKLSVQAKSVGSSLGATQFALHEVSGNITITTNGKGTLRVPYLMVPRARANVAASQTVVKASPVSPNGRTQVNGTSSPSPSTSSSPSGSPSPTVSASPSPSASPTSPTPSASPTTPPAPRYAKVKLTNRKGALRAAADFYTWGLEDTRSVSSSLPEGIDLRAAGVQSFEDGDDQLLVFAVNSWTRWSNAAAHEFDVEIDTDRDGEPDFIVFSADSGAVRVGDENGLTEVFIYDIANRALGASGFLAQAPTDSSTILLPVMAADLGITSETGAFDYTVASYSMTDESASDSFTGVATYDPWKPAITNGEFATVPINGSRTVQLTFDPVALADQKPLGTMVVVLDNRSGRDEALLLPRPKF